ncbi:AMP-binding protein [Amycolatopsis taiwanensis]|uniref:AMP-binding protein n=1 Tax=Amycolatopsis taiwanensis TaxID=342230 RepID=UPI000487E954|nr:AMP-binding protein [Amycolatopsis taiwanensis]
MDTFAEIVRARATDDHIGVRFGDEQWRWSEVVAEAAARASILESLRGDGDQLHIGVLLENVPDYLFWTCAAAVAGSVVVGINPTRRGAELARDIRHTDCDVIITEDRLAGLLDGVDHGVRWMLDIDSAPYRDLLAQHRNAALPERLPDPKAILLLLFSSGSTGAPKAVICSQGRLAMLAETLRIRSEMDRDSVGYLCMPLFHGNSMMMNFAPAMYVGATICLARKFSASGFVRDIHRYQATYVNYVGRALSYVLAVPETPQDRHCALRLALGTEASAADVKRFSERFNCRVSEGYGMSEGVLRINRTPDTPADSLGLPVGGADIRVRNEQTGLDCPPARIDPSGRLCNPDEAIGQIVAIGKAPAFEGYYRNPEAQAERVRGEDFWTGDLAYRDEAGYFYFAGRSSDWLRVDSENFAAGPVERILQRWEHVSAALVYAVPDPRTGDQVMCALRMADGARFDPDAFTSFLDAQTDLGTKWRPRFVRLIDEVPMTGNSKVAKTPLRSAAWVTSDPVYWRAGKDTRYRPFDRGQREALSKEFAEFGRSALLPVGE